MRVLAAAVLLALLAAPAADARPTTLFVHAFSASEEFVLNTQEPDPAFTLDESAGTAAMTDSCLPDNPVLAPQDAHTLAGLPTPSAVDYLTQPLHIPARRGLGGDVRILSSPMVLHWYWSEDGPGPDGAPPTPVPDVVVRATLQVGDTIHAPAGTPGEGPVVAAGESEPALLAGPASQGVEHDQVGGRTVYHFAVPMAVDPEAATLARGPAFTLRVETFVRNDACANGKVMPDAVRLHSSPGHRPRLELDAGEPLSLGLPLHAQVVESAGKPVLRSLLLHAKVVDSWGDGDLALVEATAEGPALERTAMERAAVLQPVRIYDEGIVTFYVTGERPFAAGNYSFHVSAATRQGANGTWEASLPLGEPEESPGLGPVVVALAALGAAVACRRRA